MLCKVIKQKIQYKPIRWQFIRIAHNRNDLDVSYTGGIDGFVDIIFRPFRYWTDYLLTNKNAHKIVGLGETQTGRAQNANAADISPADLEFRIMWVKSLSQLICKDAIEVDNKLAFCQSIFENLWGISFGGYLRFESLLDLYSIACIFGVLLPSPNYGPNPANRLYFVMNAERWANKKPTKAFQILLISGTVWPLLDRESGVDCVVRS